MSARNPLVETLARLCAVVVWRAIAAFNAESDVWTRRSIY